MKRRFVIPALVVLAVLVMGAVPYLAVREKIAIDARDDSWIWNGADLIFYSDDHVTQKAVIEGSTGHIAAGPAYFNAPTAQATTTPALFVNSAGVGNVFEARKNATPVFSVDGSGNVTQKGSSSASGPLYVNAPTAIATATPALFVNSAGVSNLFEARKNATPVFSIGGTGNLQSTDGLDVTGGWPATAGSADVVDITETAAIQDGTDTMQGIDVNLTGADFTGTGNEIIGLDLGLTTPDVQARERAIVVDDTDWEMAIDAGPNVLFTSSQRWMEDFFGDTIHSELILLSGTDDVAVDPALAQDQFGVATLVGGDIGNGVVAEDASQLALGLHWTANQGGLVFETRLHSDTDVTTMEMCVGLSDSVALEMPATIAAGDAVTYVASDFVGFCYDTRADTDVWFALAVDSTVAGTGAGATAVAPVADTYQVLRIEVDASGAQARYYINGVLVKTVTEGAISPDVLIGPVVVMMSVAANAQTIDVDYVLVDSKR